MTKILVTGKTGQVGSELVSALAPLGSVIALDRKQMDLANSDSIRSAIREAKPEIIVNAAGYSPGSRTITWTTRETSGSSLMASMMLDDRPLPEARYRVMRKDVAEAYGIPAVDASGWEVTAELAGWPRKCYAASLRMVRLDGSAWRSSPLAKICLG